MIHVIEEAQRCLQCRKPLCMTGCPISTGIPQMIKLLKENRVHEAGKMLFENNPLSVVCSLVCDHQKQCEGHCVLGRKGQSVHISSIENYISETCLDTVEIDKAPDNGDMVAVIGAGPAGITIAIEMRKRGYDVTIFDSRDKIGGVMRYGIPEFRLPKSLLDRYKSRLRALGIQIRPNTTIGGALVIDDLLRDGYKAIFIGTGVWRPKKYTEPKYTEPVSQETELQGCSIDGNLDSTESGAGDYARRFVKGTSLDGVTSDKKLHKSLVIEVSCEASRCAR